MPEHNRPARTFIEWLGFRDSPDWSKRPTLGGFIGALLGLAGFVAVGSALVAVPVVIWHTIIQALSPESSGPNLGAGALIATILGAPFLIWGTVIKQKTVDFQKEGHLTDRISKAVEQLGAEKAGSRMMRNVKYDLDGVTYHDFRGKEDKGTLPHGATNIVHGEWQTVQRTVPNIEVRIGGLLSLERIAQDSVAYDKGRDHVRVMEIICAYVRENAPAKDAVTFPLPDWDPLPDDATAERKQDHENWRGARFRESVLDSNAWQWAQRLPKPRQDLALAVHIIGRRTTEQKRIEARWGPDAAPDAEWVFDTPCPKLPEREDNAPLGTEAIKAFKSGLETWQQALDAFKGYRPDLRNTNLQRHDLSARDLSGCLLSGARLEGADLREARFEGADLSQTRLEGANLGGVRLVGASLKATGFEGVYLGNAHLKGADLRTARLEGADIEEARLEGADLRQARLEGADLRRARMEGTDLREARLNGAILIATKLDEADLREARLQDAFLGSARLERANLSAAWLNRADLRYAWLEGANLTNTRLIGANIQEARLENIRSLTGATFSGAALRNLSLSGCPISPEQVEENFGDASIRDLPGGMAPPSHWATRELDPVHFETEWWRWLAER